MNNNPEVIDDIDIESEISDDDPEAINDRQDTASDEVSGDALDDSQLGQDLGQLITEIRRDEENFQHSGEEATEDLEPDPFDPSHFSLDTPFRDAASQSEAPSPGESPEKDETSESAAAVETGTGQGAEVSDMESAAVQPDRGARLEVDSPTPSIAQLVSEIETALQRFTEGERRRADQLIAEKEARVAEQYRKVRNLADKVAKQKAQIQEAKNELKAKLELADRLHIEFDGIRQVLNGKLGILDQLDKEEKAAE